MYFFSPSYLLLKVYFVVNDLFLHRKKITCSETIWGKQNDNLWSVPGFYEVDTKSSNQIVGFPCFMRFINDHVGLVHSKVKSVLIQLNNLLTSLKSFFWSGRCLAFSLVIKILMNLSFS